MRVPLAILCAAVLAGCNSTKAEVWTASECEQVRPRDQAQPIEVVQDTSGLAFRTLGHIRAGGNTRAYEAMERVKDEARKLGANALTNVHRVTGTDEAIYEADAIQWLGG